jgi:hypothetical protein
MGKLTQQEWECAVAESARKATSIALPLLKPAVMALASYSVEKRGDCAVCWVPNFRIRLGQRCRSFRQ